MSMRARHLAVFALAVCAVLLLAPRAVLADDCGSVELGGFTITVDSDHLVARKAGRDAARHQLPVVGSAWHCLKLMPFPDQGLVFVEWHGGAAGTSVIVRRISLLAFGVRDDAVLPLRGWLLHESSTDDGDLATHRQYRLTPTDYGEVIVELSGTLRAGVSGWQRPHPQPWW